jgi:hypothetical protein
MRRNERKSKGNGRSRRTNQSLHNYDTAGGWLVNRDSFDFGWQAPYFKSEKGLRRGFDIPQRVVWLGFPGLREMADVLICWRQWRQQERKKSYGPHDN